MMMMPQAGRKHRQCIDTSLVHWFGKIYSLLVTPIICIISMGMLRRNSYDSFSSLNERILGCHQNLQIDIFLIFCSVLIQNSKWLGHSPVLNIKSVRSRKCKLQLDHLDQICKQTLRFTAVMYERPQPCQPHAAHADQVQVWRVWNRIYSNNKWMENVNNQESQFIMEWLSLFRQQGETTGSARNQVAAK